MGQTVKKEHLVNYMVLTPIIYRGEISRIFVLYRVLLQ
jgi:hypothetical protein